MLTERPHGVSSIPCSSVPNFYLRLSQTLFPFFSLLPSLAHLPHSQRANSFQQAPVSSKDFTRNSMWWQKCKPIFHDICSFSLARGCASPVTHSSLAKPFPSNTNSPWKYHCPHASAHSAKQKPGRRLQSVIHFPSSSTALKKLRKFFTEQERFLLGTGLGVEFAPKSFFFPENFI